METSDRYIRQRDIVPAGRLAGLQPTVIGVGAVGRQVAIQLAAMGVARLQLIDPDTVGIENLSPQGYLEADVGQPKVRATADLCRRLRGDLPVSEHAHRFRRSMAMGDVVFCCVDAIATRQVIWESVGGGAPFFADTRMSAEVVRVLTATCPAARAYYPSTLFAPEDAHVGACTSRSTIYAASLAAALALGQFARWLRNLPVDADLMLNILTSELTVQGPSA